MEDFGQRDCSVSTLQTPPYKSAWICSKEWVSCGSNTGWAGSDKELAAGWQAVYHLGKHEDNRAGRRTFCKICPSWAPSALTTWLADCSSLSLCPQKPTWKDRVPALLSAFESWEYRNGSWGTEGLQRLWLRCSQRWPLVGGRECWVDGPWTPKRSAFFVPETWPCHPNTTCPELYFHCVLVAPGGDCGPHPASQLGAGGDGGEGHGVNTRAGGVEVARVHIAQQRIYRQVNSSSAEVSFACAQCTWKRWFTAVPVPAQN